MGKEIKVNGAGEAAPDVGEPVYFTCVPRRLVENVMNQAEVYMKECETGRAIMDKLHGPSRRERRNIVLTAEEMEYLNAICLHNAL